MEEMQFEDVLALGALVFGPSKVEVVLAGNVDQDSATEIYRSLSRDLFELF
jgi:hypothetical protein